MQAPGFQDQDYILYNDPAKIYTHPVFTIVPAECPFTTAYSYTKLTDGSTAITQATDDETTHSISWTPDSPLSLAPYGQTETVKVVVTSYSTYGDEVNSARTAEDSFEVTYLNPCFDSAFFSISTADIISQIDYPVGAGPKKVIHQEPVITLTPKVTASKIEEACGPIKYTINYKYVIVTVDSEPMSYV